MIKVLKYLNRRQWSWIGISVLFIVGQVWLDLKISPTKGHIERLQDELRFKDESSVHRHKREALRRFTIAYYGVEKS